MKKWVKVGLLCAIILVNILLAYQPHFNYSYPLLTDEYNHISFAKYIVNEHKLPFTNPYLAYPEKSTNLESGFHFFLAILFSIIPGEPVLYYKYFIIVFMIVNSLLLFYLVMLWYKNYYIALLSVLFYGTIKSTGDLLVHNYFLPLTIGITLLLLSFIFFYKWERSKEIKNKYSLYLLITILITSITYPPTLTFFIGIIMFYIFLGPHNIHEKFSLNRNEFFFYSAGLCLTIIILIIFLVIHFNLTNYLIFPDSWTPIDAKYSPIFFFGLIPSIFALIGIFSLIKKRDSNIVFSWFLFSLVQIYMYYIFRFNVIVPFARVFTFYLIGMSILSGIGTIFIHKILEDKFNGKIKYIKLILVASVIVLISVNYVFVLKTTVNVPHIIEDKDYEAMKFIKNNYNGDVVIIADGLTSSAVYSMSNEKVIGILGANLGGGSPEKTAKFAYSSCKEKENDIKTMKNIKKNMNIEKIKKVIFISNFPQNCTSLKLIYNKEIYLYEIDLTD